MKKEEESKKVQILKESDSNALMMIDPHLRRDYQKSIGVWQSRFEEFLTLLHRINIPAYLVAQRAEKQPESELVKRFLSLYPKEHLITSSISDLDVWVRDFGCLTCRDQHGQKGLKFRYNPCYLKSEPGILKSSRNMYYPFKPKDVYEAPIALDGGNIDFYKDQLVCVDSIYKNEMNKSLAPAQIKATLKDYGISDLITIPGEPDDETAHIDGVLKIIDDKYILVNDYKSYVDDFCPDFCPDFLDQSEKDSYLNYHNSLRDAIRQSLPKLEIVDWPLCYFSDAIKDHMDSAAGSYINFVRVQNKFILPSYCQTSQTKSKGLGPHLQEVESHCKSILERLVPNAEVYFANSLGISDFGGSWRCLTLNLHI